MTRLKQLEINGFKSFANPTTFVFDDGITAIIGPNGSGKSNVAEALRWALGEQQYSALRGRRTEDIIFAGSDRRGQMGMAEVSLTIDNSDGGLPIAFSEVTITRRAHRSGENQYLINGSRVRLRDVQQVTAPLGQTHTIIGQGLVDAVLSQRPDDRRGLFEHAAGITGLRIQATTAERSLNEADDNASRLRDILNELEPRVRSLARSAKQAREYSTVRDELQQLQRQYYGALWRDGLEKQRQARQALREADEALEAVEVQHTTASQTLSELRASQRQLQQEREETDRQIARRERELAEARHRIDLLQAEKAAAEDRISDLERVIGDLETQQAAIAESQEQAGVTQETLQSELAELQQNLAERESRGQAVREEREAAEKRMSEVDQRLLALARERVTLEGQHQSAGDRARQLTNERGDLENSVRDLEETIDSMQRGHADRNRRIESLRKQLEETSQAQETLQAKLEDRKKALSESSSLVDAMQRDLDRATERLALLERGYEEGEGLYAGVRALIRAERGGKLDIPGLAGTVAENIEVPPHLEQAVEVALGGHLQDVIVKSWSDAEVGISFLKERQEGRATFQPLDSVRSNRRNSNAPQKPGVVGIASDLIAYSDETAPVIEFLLGRTLIVEDLKASRNILEASRQWTLVTLDGEITRPSGSVTGGSRSRAGGLLKRERERRNLPAEIEQQQEQLQQLQDRAKQETQSLNELEQEIAGARTRAEELAREIRLLEQDHRDGEQELDRLRDRREQRESRIVQIDAQLSEAAAQHDDTGHKLQEQDEEQSALEREREELARKLFTLASADDESIAEIKVTIASTSERLRSTERELDNLAQRTRETSTAIESRSAELQSRREAVAAIEGRQAESQQQLESAAEAVEQVRLAHGPLDRRRDELTEQIAKAETALDQTISRMREAERDRDHAALDSARARDEEAFLAERIKNDLDIDDPEPLVSEAADDASQIENSIRRLRERLRRMSAVGEDVVQEYEQESTRYDYLSEQLDDVEQAAQSLREVLHDLNRRMTERFSTTFTEVAKEFEQTFKRLFGGGAAHLTLDDREGETGGVDIAARPPGKKLQGLNQLSGGERALTAVALLIAIQRVNPSPFCLLDEVDAALDESNVLRFRKELSDLASNIQFIVITHNRGTIEGADTLYGVTMGEDSVSRVVSLRLDQALLTIEEEEPVESII